MKPESKLAAQFKRYVLGGMTVFNVHGEMMQSIGWPDFYVADSESGQFWIEFKVWPNHIDLQKNIRQKQRITELENHGVRVFIVTLDPRGIGSIIVDHGSGQEEFDADLKKVGGKIREHLRSWV